MAIGLGLPTLRDLPWGARSEMGRAGLGAELGGDYRLPVTSEATPL